MTPTELQRQVKAALEKISVPVSKDFSEFEDTYPHIVYGEVSNVPVLRGDDCELVYRAVYKITIVTNNDEYEDLEVAVTKAMLGLGFVRKDAQDVRDGNFNRVLQFSTTKSSLP